MGRKRIVTADTREGSEHSDVTGTDFTKQDGSAGRGMDTVLGADTSGASTLSVVKPLPVTHATPGVEVAVPIPDGTKAFSIKNKDTGNLKIAFISGDASAAGIDIFKGTLRSFPDLSTKNVILYIISDKASQTLEVVIAS